MMNLISIELPFVGVLVLLLVIGIVAAKLYTRSSQERAFVRTGLGGMKVVMSGGAMVLPIFHEIVWVNRNTLRLKVERDKNQSLITGDRLRVDVTAEFYVRVAQTADMVAIAAQTLGQRTLNPEQLKELVEGKFVDALRSAAASMTMQQLHAQRAEFVQNVKVAVTKDLAENGLELESVSLTGLNQTAKDYFDPNNAFDAEGLLKLTQEIESRNKERNDVEQETAVQIASKNLDASKRQLALRLEGETAQLNTDRDIAAATADTQATIAQTAAEGRRRAEEANLVANQLVEIKKAETERTTETARIDTRTAVQIRTQETNIEVSRKSEEEAAAQTSANKAQALAVASEEQVETARQVEVAERNKKVTLVKAEEVAREAATGVTVAAEAEKTAAADRAEALKTVATGERDASLLRAEGTIAEGNAVAQALSEKNTAQNILSPAVLAQHVKLALLEVLPSVIEQSVKPMENIDSIRIAEVGGLFGGGNGGGAGNGAARSGSASNGGLGNEMVTAALNYRGAQPVVDALLSEVGLKGGGDMSMLMHSAASLAGVNMAGGAATAVAAAPDAVAGSDTSTDA